MARCADRMSPAHRIVLRCLLVMAICLSQGPQVHAQSGTTRTATRGNAGLQLPPRGIASDRATSSESKSSSPGTGLWTTIISLGVIVGALVLTGRGLKPYLGAQRSLPIEALELLGRRMIEPKVTIHLVRCGGKVLVLGVSPEGVRTLSEIVDPREVDRMVEACLNRSEPARSTAGQRGASSRESSPSASVSRSREPRLVPYPSTEETHHA